MSGDLTHFSDRTLAALIERLSKPEARFPPGSTEIYEALDGHKSRHELAALFKTMADQGLDGRAAVWALRLALAEREAERAKAPRVIPVWSGLDVGGVTWRSAIALQDLFREAQRRVWISTFNIDTGSKAKALFDNLAARLDLGELSVRIFINIKRDRARHRGWEDEAVLAEFRKRFRDQIWPGKRLPEVYYDPRALNLDGDTMSCLHAKCVMIDDSRILITSANFSEAAQERNIEAGVIIDDDCTVRTYVTQFGALVDNGALQPLIFKDR